MKHQRILIVEDDDLAAEALGMYLENQGYAVVTFGDSTSALNFLYDNDINLILLDMNLPDVSGMASITSIKRYTDAPIIAISAENDTNIIVQALMIGCDDYIVKPIENKILLARIFVQLRRYAKFDIKVQQSKELILKNSDFYLGNEKLVLTAKEYQILEYLYLYKNNPVQKIELAKILKVDIENSRVIDTHIKNIRVKLNDDSKSPKYIKSLYGQGIVLNPNH